ncbi:MAG TPA: NUDIX domain-containing protein [Tepidisphaeraceae bacterium]|jgi:dATP pyrophosphohydrolase
MKQTIYAVNLVIRQTSSGGELLLALRAPSRYMGETWQLITGKVEPGEPVWQAALRELKEETGLAPVEFYRLTTLATFYHPTDDSLNTGVMFCAIVAPDAAVKLNDEHTAFRWIAAHDAPAALTWPADKAAFAEVDREILNDGPLRTHLRIKLDNR